MVNTCCVYKCHNRASKGSSITFHSFPSKNDKDRFDAWVRAINRQTKTGRLWTPTTHHKVCSEHFVESDFRSNTNIRSLRANSVPSVFPHHLQKTAQTGRPKPKKRAYSFSDSDDDGASASKHLLHDHSYTPFNTPKEHVRHLQDKINSLEKSLRESKAVKKNLKERLKRRDLKCHNLINLLREEKVISDEKAALLDHNFDKDTLALIENELQAERSSANNHCYSEIVKSFAVTVHFYSPQAYDYLRNFLHLPNSSTIRRWASSLNCEPGFLMDVITKLEEDLSLDGDMRDVCIMFDAIAIKKECVYDSKNGCFAGDVNFGPFLESKGEMATEALMFMAVGVKGHWKKPIGYFLGKADGTLQAQLVKYAVCLLSERGFNVVGVTCDGSYANQSTARMLGCNFNASPLELDPSFPHPDDSEKKIPFIFDACHLLKCVRNCLGDLKRIMYKGQSIEWKYIESLHRIQLQDDLNLSNKVTHRHINYEKAKMNVRLAAQTMSNSVADAIDYLRDDEGHDDFVGSEATCQFIRNIDQLFDLCNSRNPLANGYKSRIDNRNLVSKTTLFRKICKYLMELEDTNGKPLVQGKRKTPFLGFIVTAESLCRICESLLKREQNPFKYVLTYKFSQDHLETFFSRLRRKGGWNNNPNALQLKWSLRSLLLHNGVVASNSANAVDIEEPQTAIFTKQGQPDKVSKLASQYAKLVATKSAFHDNILFYIAGYICRRMVKHMRCSHCASVLSTLASRIPEMDRHSNDTLVRRKDRGGLMASNDFFIIVQTADSELRRALLSCKDPLSSMNKSLIERLKMSVYQLVHSKVFSSLSTHFLENLYLPSEEDHGVQIIKEAVNIYARLVLKHQAKLINERFLQDKPHMRHHLTKKVIFYHQ